MVDASVDLPEPLGPMMACVSPVLMVRLTPFRISLVPCSVSMLTCRSLISRVDMLFFLSVRKSGGTGRSVVVYRSTVHNVGHVHINVVSVDGDGENGDGVISRQLKGLSAAEVKLGTV